MAFMSKAGKFLPAMIALLTPVALADTWSGGEVTFRFLGEIFLESFYILGENFFSRVGLFIVTFAVLLVTGWMAILAVTKLKKGKFGQALGLLFVVLVLPTVLFFLFFVFSDVITFGVIEITRPG